MRNSDWLDIILRIYDSPSAKQCEESGIMSEKTYYNLFDCKGTGKPFATERGSSVLKREKIRAIYNGMTDIEIGYFEQSMKISSLKYASNTGGKSDLDEYAKALNKELIDLFALPLSSNAPFLTYFLWVSNIAKFYFALAYELDFEDLSSTAQESILREQSTSKLPTDIQTFFDKTKANQHCLRYSEILYGLAKDVPIDVLNRNRFVVEFSRTNMVNAYFKALVENGVDWESKKVQTLLKKGLEWNQHVSEFLPRYSAIAWNGLVFASGTKNSSMCNEWAKRLIMLDPKVEDLSGGDTVKNKSMKDFEWLTFFIDEVAPQMVGRPYWIKEAADA